MNTFRQDLHYAARMLVKNPAFTIVAVLTLALGVGANSAIFSLVHAVLLRPLPIPEPDRVVRLWESSEKYGLPYFSVRVTHFFDWREQASVFEEIAAYREDGFNLTGSHEPAHIEGARVSAGFFEVFGVPPAAGRVFLESEDRPSAPARVAILSDELWRTRYGSADLIGEALEINGESHTVIGIMPAHFSFPLEGAQLWLPFGLDREDPSGAHFLRVLGKLAPGATLAQAESEMAVIAARLGEQSPEANADWGVAMLSLHESLTGDLRSALLTLFGAVGFILLIACANVAHLILARTTVRARELSVRSALGAGRGRLLRQLLTESLLLAFVGGTLGLLVAIAVMKLLTALAQSQLGEPFAPRLDASVIVFTFFAALATNLAFTLIPAWRAVRPGLAASVRQGGLTQQDKARELLVIAEVALALVLLIGSGLMLRSFAQILRIDPGFDAEQVVTSELSPSEARYREPAQRAEFFRQVLERLEAIPGVTAAGAAHRLPLQGNSGTGLHARDQPLPPGERPRGVIYRAITPGYFEAIGMRMLRGRSLNANEAFIDGNAAVVNQSLANHYWPDQIAVGKEIATGSGAGPWLTVVGVVADARESALEEAPAMAVYLPYRDHASMALVIRTETPLTHLAPAIREGVREIDPDQPISSLVPMDQVVTESLGQPRLMTVLLGCFAATALLLALAGIYGVLSYGVARRTRELGLRQALGASPREIFSLVIGEGARMTAAGVSLGLLLALALSSLAESFLYQVEATDPWTYAGVSLLLIGVALSAEFLPARRATRIAPTVALHHDGR